MPWSAGPGLFARVIPNCWHRPLINLERKDIRPRVMPDRIEIDSTACDIVCVQLGRKHTFLVPQRAGKELAER